MMIKPEDNQYLAIKSVRSFYRYTVNIVVEVVVIVATFTSSIPTLSLFLSLLDSENCYFQLKYSFSFQHANMGALEQIVNIDVLIARMEVG